MKNCSKLCKHILIKRVWLGTLKDQYVDLTTATQHLFS